MNIEEVKAEKRLLEINIALKVRLLVDNFVEKTGVQISSVGIDIIDTSVVGGESSYIIGEVSTSIGL